MPANALRRRTIELMLVRKGTLRRRTEHNKTKSWGIASSMVEYYTSDIAILVRFQCDAVIHLWITYRVISDMIVMTLFKDSTVY